jgi:hypothetical protein
MPEPPNQRPVPWDYTVRKPFHHVFWRAFIADRWLQDGERVASYTAPAPAEAWDSVLHYLNRDPDPQLASAPRFLCELLWPGPPDYDVEAIWANNRTTELLVVNSLLSTCTARTAFITAGGWLGFGPFCMEAGDIVVVFAGADVPFVVRRTQDGSGDFLLVGEAYVDGLMFGELFEHCPAFNGEDDGYKIRLQRFCFC